MEYLRVVNPNDLQIINPKSQWIFIHRELYTIREIEKLKLPTVINFFNSKTAKHDSIKTCDLFEAVNISKNKTHFSFGARFEQFNPLN